MTELLSLLATDIIEEAILDLLLDYGGEKNSRNAQQQSIEFFKGQWFVGLCDLAGFNHKRLLDLIKVYDEKWLEKHFRTVKYRGKLYAIDGVIKTIPEWCRVYNVKNSLVLNRLENGKTLLEALTTPVKDMKNSWKNKENVNLQIK